MAVTYLVSNGQLVMTTPPTPFPRVSPRTQMPGMSSGGWGDNYGEIYRRQLWVYVVIDKRAKATARLPLPVYRRHGDGRPREDQHPMARLLTAPNPAMDSWRIWLWTSSTRDIFGRTFWWKERSANNHVAALWPLHPSGMSQNPDGSWSFSNGRLRMSEIPPADLVQFAGFDPDINGLFRGMSPLEPLRATLENEWKARAATSSFWDNGARPSLVVAHPKTLSQKAHDRLRDEMEAQHQGSGNTGSVLILEEGMDAKPYQLTAEEAQYIETRKLNREEVCAAFDMPPPVVHILDRATFSNITEQMRSMYRDTMGNHLPGFESAIEVDLRRAEWASDDVYAEFMMDEVMRGDFETRQAALSSATHMTIAEKRRVENLPFIPGTDRIFLNTATLPLDAIDAQSAAIAAAPKTQVVTNGVRTLLGRLSWQKAIADVDLASVLSGMPEELLVPISRAYADATTIDEFRTALKALTQGAQT